MRRVSQLLIAAAFFVASSGASTASSSSQTFKVKTPRGLKTNLTLALNDDANDVLIAYESKGEILATLAKSRTNGKSRANERFKAKKAKPVSGGGGINHRPAIAFDPRVNEFLASWDSGPEDLQAAADASDPGAGDILSRRIRSKNGKKFKSVIPTVSDGRLNIGPQLAVRDGGIEVFYTRHGQPGTVARANVESRAHFLQTDQGLARGESLPLGKLETGIVRLTEVRLTLGITGFSNEGICLDAARYLAKDRELLTRLMEVDQEDGQLETVLEFRLGLPPGIVKAQAVWLREIGYKAVAWRTAKAVLMAFVNRAGEQSPAQDLGLAEASSFVADTGDASAGRSNPSSRSRADRAWLAGVTQQGQIQALEIGGAAQIFQRVDVLKRKKDIAEIEWVVLPDGRFMLVWIESKNKKSQDVWAHVFDLPR